MNKAKMIKIGKLRNKRMTVGQIRELFPQNSREDIVKAIRWFVRRKVTGPTWWQ